MVDEEKFVLQYCHEIGEMQIRTADKAWPVHIYKSSAKTGKRDVEIFFIDCPYYFYRDRIYTTDPKMNVLFYFQKQ